MADRLDDGKTAPALVSIIVPSYSGCKQDIAGPIENSVEVIDGDYNCNLFLCRGYQYEDNVDNALSLATGEVVDIHIDIIAGHTPGYAVCLHLSHMKVIRLMIFFFRIFL